MDFSSSSTWIYLIGYIIIGVIGSVCNALFIFVLVRSKTVRHVLGTSAILVGARVSINFLTSSVAIPLRMYNMFGPAAPRAGSVLLTITHRLYFSCTRSSMWITCVLATCRLLAVYTPHFYRRNIGRRPLVLMGFGVFAVLMGFSTTIIGLPASWYVVRPSPSTGISNSFPSANTTEALATYRLFVKIETATDTWLPLPLGLLFYAFIYARLYWRNRQKRMRQQVANPQLAAPTFPTTFPLNSGGGPTNPVVAPVVVTVTRVIRMNGAPAEPTTTAAHGENVKQATKNLVNESPSQTDSMLRKLRLLFAATVVDLVLMFPNQLLFALGLFILPGFNARWLLATLSVLYASASALNLWVYVVMSKEIRAECRRVLLCRHS